MAVEVAHRRIPLLYALHSGNLYGTERMAIATVETLLDDFEPVFFAPPGPAIEEIRRRGWRGETFTSPREFFFKFRPHLKASRRAAFFATGLVHSLACLTLNAVYRRKLVHLHLVHGGTDERLSYGRKKLLNGMGVTFVAVSDFVRERLVAHGTDAKRIVVVENFLTDERIAEAPRRAAFEAGGVKNVVIVSRVDPIKRVDLLLDALDRHPDLAELSFRILGTGSKFEGLRERAAASHPNVTFVGFTDRVSQELASADALLHLCPAEPFGLVLLEGMAARLPLVVPDRGGAGGVVPPGAGLHFRADDPDDLAAQLRRLRGSGADELNGMIAEAGRVLAERYSAAAGEAAYRNLLKGLFP